MALLLSCPALRFALRAGCCGTILPALREARLIIETKLLNTQPALCLLLRELLPRAGPLLCCHVASSHFIAAPTQTVVALLAAACNLLACNAVTLVAHCTLSLHTRACSQAKGASPVRISSYMH
jgi:hypothetical protein